MSKLKQSRKTRLISSPQPEFCQAGIASPEIEEYAAESARNSKRMPHLNGQVNYTMDAARDDNEYEMDADDLGI